MSIVGQWTLHYSWGCSGSYNQSTVTFKNDGTFTTGDGYKGQWAMLAGNVHWVYEPTPSAVYSGNVIGGAMAGLMTNFSNGGQGCWYATFPTIPAAHATEKKVAGAESLDSMGAKKKK
ncbi:MAG TPA: hypothetical protein VH988_00455 [Thermoanaerobaculia bacterium]|jgi:hypothetical protein|nr:hypothetical protein [Thermoanaerobaculia bacterium]